METSDNKIQKICDILTKETLDPAKQEASEIVENAHLKAEEIVQKAKSDAEAARNAVEKELTEKKKVFDASLNLACKQTIESLREKIEKQFFNEALQKLVQTPLKDLSVISQLITTIVKAIDEEGIDADLSAYVQKEIPAKKVNELLASSIIDKLKEKSVVVEGTNAGVQIKIHDENITMDLSDEALKELVSQFVRRDFREMFFNK